MIENSEISSSTASLGEYKFILNKSKFLYNELLEFTPRKGEIHRVVRSNHCIYRALGKNFFCKGRSLQKVTEMHMSSHTHLQIITRLTKNGIRNIY
jgi:hypothetical protein